MKILFALMLLVIVISLTACADAAVSYSLTNDNTLNIDYSFTFLSEGEDISDNLSSIKDYWTDMGFTAEDSENNGVFTLNGEKTVNYDSRGSAVKELSRLLTDEGSLFYDVKLTYTPSYFEDLYDLSANISLEDIIRKSEDSNIPSAEIDLILEGAKNSSYKLSIELPGEVLETNADEQDGQTCTWLLKYGEASRLELKTKRIFEDNVSHYESLNEAQSRDNLLFTIGCAAGGFLLILIIIVAAIRRKKARRSSRSEIYVERF